MGQEGVAVGAGPRAVGIGIGVVRDGEPNLLDHCIDPWPAPLERYVRPSPEPVIIRSHPVDAHGRGAVGDTKPQDLVASKAGRSGRFHRTPGVNREDAVPGWRVYRAAAALFGW